MCTIPTFKKVQKKRCCHVRYPGTDPCSAFSWNSCECSDGDVSSGLLVPLASSEHRLSTVVLTFPTQPWLHIKETVSPRGNSTWRVQTPRDKGQTDKDRQAGLAERALNTTQLHSCLVCQFSFRFRVWKLLHRGDLPVPQLTFSCFMCLRRRSSR